MTDKRRHNFIIYLTLAQLHFKKKDKLAKEKNSSFYIITIYSYFFALFTG